MPTPSYLPPHPESLTPATLAGLIDHTLLKPEAVASQFEQLCREAATYRFASVCVNPSWVRFCAARLSGSGIPVCTVVGFPLGAIQTESKVEETNRAIAEGATEIDMVLHAGWLKSGYQDQVLNDIASVVRAAAPHTVKVILETCLLSEEEKITACALSRAAGARFVKTSTGFGKTGATVADVALMRRCIGDALGVKASGGIRDLKTALAMIGAGANRIGASASIDIITAMKS
ncbi:MAG TPA: deoxyribose-phosphate aldolase [bacterium]|nr:deoxyribose-phosphate aldolase [bacterium]HQG46014.1 deoxyribose-phosphate aldolase [bacterium]HQI47548.1 deoxyribose-phosphate aldolase [bacterium]HQJ63324.1 deoxyribose-phosphate aldolase [bacterium]